MGGFCLVKENSKRKVFYQRGYYITCNGQYIGSPSRPLNIPTGSLKSRLVPATWWRWPLYMAWRTSYGSVQCIVYSVQCIVHTLFCFVFINSDCSVLLQQMTKPSHYSAQCIVYSLYCIQCKFVTILLRDPQDVSMKAY